MKNEPVTLVRYGLMGHVGRFAGILPGDPASDLPRGLVVVVRTDRGDELGEVLLHLASSSWENDPSERSQAASAAGASTVAASASADRFRLIRAALPGDLENSRQAERLRGERFDHCRQILAEGRWPLELLDVEPLLDLDTTVLYILGPLCLDLAPLHAEFRDRCDFHMVFEHVATPPGSSLDGVTEPSSVPAQGRCEGYNCAGCLTPAHQEYAWEGENVIGERSSSAVLASCGNRFQMSCGSCPIAEGLAGER
jgi:hypothetical protein